MLAIFALVAFLYFYTTYRAEYKRRSKHDKQRNKHMKGWKDFF